MSNYRVTNEIKSKRLSTDCIPDLNLNYKPQAILLNPQRKGMHLHGLPQELGADTLWFSQPRLVSGSPRTQRRGVWTSSHLAWQGIGHGQESAVGEHNLTHTVTQRDTAPRGLGLLSRSSMVQSGTSPTAAPGHSANPLQKKECQKKKGLFSLHTANTVKMINWFFISTPAQSWSPDQIVSSMGAELDI